MTKRITPYALFVVGLLLCCASMRAGDAARKGDAVQRLTTRTMGLPITRVDTLSVTDLKITGFTGAAFEVMKALKPPCQILNLQNAPIGKGATIRIENSIVLVRVAYSPVAPGPYRDTMILQRKPPVAQQLDEIIIVVEGVAFVPSRTIHVEFGGVLVGDTATRLVRFLPEIAAGSTWKVLRPDPPFSIATDTLRLVPDPDKLGAFVHAFILRFAPVVKGPKKGQATFVRIRADNSTRILDTLIVSMSGTGEELLPRASIDFGRMMVGDSAERTVGVPIRGIGNTVYKPTYKPSGDSPFRLISANRVGDELLIAVSFSPPVMPPFSYRDSVILYRFKNSVQDTLDPLDSVVCILTGSAGEMQVSTEIQFADQRINRIDSADIQLTIPIQFELRSFSYDIKSDQSTIARVRGKVLQPDPMPSQSLTVVVRVYSTPESLGTHFDTLHLVRTHETIGVTDETAIYVTSEVKPRTVKLRASITRVVIGANDQTTFVDDEVMSARLGDTVVVAVLANTDDPIDLGLEFTTLRCSLAYNPTVLVPIVNAQDSAIVIDDGAVFVFGGPDPTAQPIKTSGRVLARASFVVVMGDAVYSALNMMNLSLEPRDFIELPELDSATVRITNVWNYQDGQSRLINPLQKNLGLDVSPNPVPAASTSKIRVINVPPGAGILQIVSSEGVVVVDYTATLRSGSPEFGFPALPRGVYFVRLMAGQNGSSEASTFDSVVRLVIVE